MNTARSAEEVTRLFVENWNKPRPDLMAEVFEEDADFINVVGLWWNNRTDIFKAHDYGLKVIFQDSNLQIIRMKTKLLSENSAVVHSKLRLTGQTKHHGEHAEDRLTILTFVVRKKEDGIWWAVSAQNTDIVGGAETYLRTANGDLKPVNYRNS